MRGLPTFEFMNNFLKILFKKHCFVGHIYQNIQMTRRDLNYLLHGVFWIRQTSKRHLVLVLDIIQYSSKQQTTRLSWYISVTLCRGRGLSIFTNLLVHWRYIGHFELDPLQWAFSSCITYAFSFSWSVCPERSML